MIKKTEFRNPAGESLDLTEDLKLEVGGEPKRPPPQTPPTHLLVTVPPTIKVIDRFRRAWNFAKHTIRGEPVSFFLPIGYSQPYWMQNSPAEAPEKVE